MHQLDSSVKELITPFILIPVHRSVEQRLLFSELCKMHRALYKRNFKDSKALEREPCLFTLSLRGTCCRVHYTVTSVLCFYGRG